MSKRGRLFIHFAVIAVIMLVVPVSFYEFSNLRYSGVNDVNIGITDNVWDVDRGGNCYGVAFFPNVTSTTTFTHGGSLNSSLSLSLRNIVGFYTSEGYCCILVNDFTISGIIHGNIRPRSIMLGQIEGAKFPYSMRFTLKPGFEKSFNTSKINCWNFTDCNYRFVNGTDFYEGWAYCNISLLNDSAGQALFLSNDGQKNITYSFSLSNRILLQLFPKCYHSVITKYFLDLSISINGLGKPVQTQINIEMIRKSAT